MHGLEVVRQGREIRPDLQPIILTGYTNDRDLITAVNLRCINRYVPKPWEPDEMRHAIDRALDDYRLIQENHRLTEELRRANKRLRAENAYLRSATTPPAEFVGTGPAMDGLRAAVSKVAARPATVLILGETGTGKELVARAIHAASDRKDRLFVAVNCAAIVDSIPESLLFGHRKGAFTGTTGDHEGYFEVANGGTIFLDEIGELPLPLQAMMLRVLQEGEVLRVGDNQPRHVDVRVIAATNRVLEDEVRERRFRQDLFYRLNQFSIVVPPLRERGGDVGTLARHFLRRHAIEMNMPEPTITPEALAALVVYDFPGNVRELSNIMQRALILAEPGEAITCAHLPANLQQAPLATPTGGLLSDAVDDFERKFIAEWLAECAGNKTRTAERLGMTYRGLHKKMKHLRMIDSDEEP
jgi:two-component system response regulator HupR/HoxA